MTAGAAPSALALALVMLAPGCGGPPPAPRETPEQAAARVFDLAEGLEKGRKTRQAFAAYRQVARDFPATPQGKKAAERIDRAQREAGLKRR